MDKHSLAIAAGVGALIGIGQLLLKDDPITLKRAVGRAIVTAGLSVAAFSILTISPGVSIEAIIGCAAALASLGTTGLERLAARWLDRKVGGPPDGGQ